MGVNLWLARRWQWQWRSQNDWYQVGMSVTPQSKQLFVPDIRPQIVATGQSSFTIRDSAQLKNYSPRLKLPLLLTAAIAGAVIITCILISYTDMALSVWQTSYRLPQISSTLKPPVFNFGDITGFLISYLRQLIVIVTIAGLLLWKPAVSLRVIAALLSLVFWSNCPQVIGR